MERSCKSFFFPHGIPYYNNIFKNISNNVNCSERITLLTLCGTCWLTIGLIKSSRIPYPVSRISLWFPSVMCVLLQLHFGGKSNIQVCLIHLVTPTYASRFFPSPNLAVNSLLFFLSLETYGRCWLSRRVPSYSSSYRVWGIKVLVCV